MNPTAVGTAAEAHDPSSAWLSGAISAWPGVVIDEQDADPRLAPSSPSSAPSSRPLTPPAANWGPALDDNASDPMSGLCAALSRLLESGELSDFVIKTKTRTIKVHKFILRQSPFFCAACDGSFKEALEGVIDLSAEDERFLDVVIQWLYSPKPTSNWGWDASSPFTLVDIVQLCETAARLGVHSLAQTVVEEFQYRLECTMGTLSPECVVDLVDVLYDDTTVGNKGLRTAFADSVARRLSKSAEKECVPIQQIIESHSLAFAADVALSLANKLRAMNRVQSQRGPGHGWGEASVLSDMWV